MPSNLDFLEAATLTCSGLTAYNALFGLNSRAPKAGMTVVVQGTGGVSIAALQFALAAGATVIATTSNAEKASRLKALGAHQVINYRETPDWGDQVNPLTRDGKGADIIVDVRGAATLQQSFKAVRPNGLIVTSGILGESADGQTPNVLDCLFAPCTVRGILLGTRRQFEEMKELIESCKVKPVVDERMFEFEEMRDAFRYLEEQRHFSKVAFRI